MRILVYLTHPHVEAWNFRKAHFDQFCRHFPGFDVLVCRNSKEFQQRLPEADGAILWFFKEKWLETCPNLKWIATPAAGADWIEPGVSERISVLFGGFHGLMMAESVLGAMLYFTKAFQLSHELQKKRKWARVKISEQIRSLYNARVTILGFGRIGQTIGRALKPFGCRLTGVKRSPIDPPDFFDENDHIITADRLMEVLPETDHWIIVLPGGAETDGLLTRDHFQRLPRHGLLYNVGRGNAICEDDLVHALREKQIAGAYLDVFETEPLPETSKLWEMDNVLIQPHLSAASPQYLELFIEELIPRLRNHLA